MFVENLSIKTPSSIEQHFREIADYLPHIMWTAEPSGTVDYLNKVYTEYTGVALDVVNQSWISALHPDDVANTLAVWTSAITSGNPYSVEFRIIHISTKEFRWQAVSAFPVRDESGRIVKWYGNCNDIHERKIADDRASRLASQLNATLESMSDGVLMLDRLWRVTYANTMAESLLKRTRPDLLGKVLWNEVDILRDSRAHHDCHRAVAERRSVESEYFSPVFHRWLEIRIYPSDDGVSMYMRDISGRKTAEAQIQRLAFFDQLTGLPNRQLLHDRLHHAMLMRKRDQSIGAVMFLDLDNFKAINDTQGHQKGDLVLQQVAARLAGCVREVDTVARLGGDEFVVMLVDLSGNSIEAASRAERIGEKIISALGQPFHVDEHQFFCTASIGITLVDAQTSSVDQLLKQADIAMYQAKAAGRNRIAFYDPAIQAATSAKMGMEAGLRESVQANLFYLRYQPQLDREGRVFGAEALVRWSHPAYKDVPPSVFIPVAEETGLISQIGRWVLEAACSQLVEWAKDVQTARLTLSVNVSAYQFRHPEIVGQVLEVIHRSGANPEKLKLELTETALVKDVEDVAAKIRALKGHGIGIALDDFGTGYSSLSYLRDLPLEQLKIDRSFTSRLPGNPSDAAIVQAIIGMGRSLGLNIVAEGVETEQQLQFLNAHGCHAYQGFFFSKPITAVEFATYLHARTIAWT